MIKKEVKQGSGNINFKLKLVKKDTPKWKHFDGGGLYAQLQKGNTYKYNYSELTSEELSKAIADIFYGKNKQRNVNRKTNGIRGKKSK
jgi:hypothetical protein